MLLLPCQGALAGFAPRPLGLSGGYGALSGRLQEPRRPRHRCSLKLIWTTPNPKLSLSPRKAGTPLTELQIALCPLDRQDGLSVSQVTPPCLSPRAAQGAGAAGSSGCSELPPEHRACSVSCRAPRWSFCLPLLPPWANPRSCWKSTASGTDGLPGSPWPLGFIVTLGKGRSGQANPSLSREVCLSLQTRRRQASSPPSRDPSGLC